MGDRLVRALARRDDLDVTLATHVRNRDALERTPVGGCDHVEFVDTDWVAGPLHKVATAVRGGKSLGWTTAMAFNWPGYVAFEYQLYKRLKNTWVDFDVVHRVTPLSPTLPSLLPGKIDVPMMIGPLNGGLPWPAEWPELRTNEREWLVPLRSAYRRLPYWRSMWRNLAGVVAGSRHTATEIPDNFNGKRWFQPENGIDPERFVIADGWTRPAGPFRFVTVGRLVPYKKMDVSIEALSRIDAPATLTVIGDGPERKNLLALAAKLGVSDRVRFCGWMPQEEVAAELRASQAFVFPSLREFGGGVVLEAMASGLPSILVDYGGPAELVDETCAICVPMATREPLLDSVTAAMTSLLENHEQCGAMGAAAAEMVRRSFTWDAKAAGVTTMYRELLGVSHTDGLENSESDCVHAVGVGANS